MSTWAFPETGPSVPLTEYTARFDDGAARVASLVAQTAVETDAILFDMRAAHDSIFSLAVDRQIVFSVQTRLFTDLAAKLAASLAAADFVVHRKVSKRNATDAAITATDVDGNTEMLEPVVSASDLASVVYPSADTGSVDNLIASVPSRSRGYALASGVRTYLSGYRADAAAATDDASATGAIARPWESSADELQTTATIIADTLRIASVFYCAQHAKADAPRVWIVSSFVYNGWSIPPFVAGRVNETYAKTIPAAYSGGPALKLTCSVDGIFTLTVSESGAPPIKLTKPSTETDPWGAVQQQPRTAAAAGFATDADARKPLNWDVAESVKFRAYQLQTEHLHECGTYVKCCVLDTIVVDDASGDYKFRWRYESGTYDNKPHELCGNVAKKDNGCKYFGHVEAAVPRLVRKAISNDAESRKQLRDELASSSPFTSTLVTVDDVTAHSTFVKEIETQVKAALSGKTVLPPYVLHACHSPTSGANSGRDDVPVIRMGAGGLWCTGQHALPATTGMLLASNAACA